MRLFLLVDFTNKGGSMHMHLLVRLLLSWCKKSSVFNTKSIVFAIFLVLTTCCLVPFSNATEIDLNQGWNLVAFYPQPKKTKISKIIDPIKSSVNLIQTVKEGQLLTYDPANESDATLTDVEGGRGYWFSMKEDATLTFDTLSRKGLVSLENSWNLMGLYITEETPVDEAMAAYKGKFSYIWGYSKSGWQLYDVNNANFNNLTTMEPNKGYYVLMTEGIDHEGGVDDNPFAEDENAPKALIDAPNAARLNQVIYLDGRVSFSPDGNTVTYKWTVESFPNGADSAYTLSNDTSGLATFKSPIEGEYKISLIINNGTEDSKPNILTLVLDASGTGVTSADNNDKDGDGIDNDKDSFSDDSGEFVDSDGDGTGNFADTDEDGDGTIDEDDYYPFDATLTAYTLFAETETNDNPTIANSVLNTSGSQISYPFSLTGVIDIHTWDSKTVDEDSDYFKFTGNAGDVITAVVFKTGSYSDDFKPDISFLDSNGIALTNIETNVNDNVFAAVASSVISTDGDHFIAINDKNLGDNSSWTYQIDVFKDGDFDAVDDSRELALGCNNSKPDSDNDGLYDSTETLITDKTNLAKAASVTLFDVDQNGVPNWFDYDSDGDEVPDRLEGYSDWDEDKLPNFLDTDSDGNGITDKDEAGANPEFPQDSDNDGLYDFADLDDDNDCIWDTYDNERLTVLDPTANISIASYYITTNSNTIMSVIKPGTVLTIEGSGFSDTPTNNIVIFKGKNDIYNLASATATNSQLTVTVPRGTYGSIAVLNIDDSSAYKLSGFEPVSYISDGQPVLYELDYSDGVGNLTTGTVLTLNGENLTSVATVCFGSITTTVTSAAATVVTVTIPTDAESGGIYVITSNNQESNTIGAKITKPTTAQVTLPTGATTNITSLEVETGLITVTNPDATGACNIPIDNTKMDYITAFVPDDPAAGEIQTPYMTGISFPNDTTVAINSTTTAVAFTLGCNQPGNNGHVNIPKGCN